MTKRTNGAYRDFVRHLSAALLIALVGASACLAQEGERSRKPPATHADVAYGAHERNVLDVWLAGSDRPTPLVIYIHGGGFRNGSKEGVSAAALRELLDNNISVAALNYRFVAQQRLPAAHHDCRRALQFLRSKADEWNLDKKRIGAFGGSAGAQLCMYLAFHDEMADTTSTDPIEHESTRLACVATTGGQTTMDFEWWQKWIPGYDSPHRDPFETFDASNDDELRTIVADVSALALISADDPPIHMSYGMTPTDPIPAESENPSGWKVHHVMFGIKLKERMDALGIEADLKYPKAETTYRSIPHFFISKLAGSN